MKIFLHINTYISDVDWLRQFSVIDCVWGESKDTQAYAAHSITSKVSNINLLSVPMSKIILVEIKDMLRQQKRITGS